MALQFKSGLIALALVTAGWTTPCSGQTPQRLPVPTSENSAEHNPKSQGTAPVVESPPDQGASESIRGAVVDQSGAVVAGAQVMLTGKNLSLNQEVLSGDDGQFSFANVAPGPFQLTITSAGFATQTSSGILLSGEIHTVPQIVVQMCIRDRLTGDAWERLPEPRPRLILEVCAPDGAVREFALGPHTPRMRPQDVELMHRLWLNITADPKYAGAHHYHIMALALEELQRELSTCLLYTSRCV